jgi:hypothetical protein
VSASQVLENGQETISTVRKFCRATQAINIKLQSNNVRLSLVCTASTVTEQGPYFMSRAEFTNMRQETGDLAVTRFIQ